MSDAQRMLRLLIMDASVLIDFLKAGRETVCDVCRFSERVCITSTMVAEVREVGGEEELASLGLEIIEPEPEDVLRASDFAGSTSLEDRICCYTAQRHGLSCVTNDKALRRLCESEGVAVVWGLELIGELLRAGMYNAERALAIANTIHARNPLHISKTRIQEFRHKYLSGE